MSTTSEQETGGCCRTDESAAAEAALRRCFAENFSELRRLARVLVDRDNGWLSPTELVHEAFLQLAGQPQVAGRGRTFFVGCFARQCRRILVDEVRRQRASCRGGDRRRYTLHTAVPLSREAGLDLLELDEIIERLHELDERLANIVDMRVFGGLTIGECARVLGVSRRQVDKLWSLARAWLRQELRP